MRWWGLFLALTLSQAVWADDRPVLLASYRDNPPDLVAYCADGHSGPLRYVVEEAAAGAGYRVKWRRLSLADSLREQKDGKLDIIPYLFTKTTERLAVGRFSEGLGGKLRTVSFLQRTDDARSIKQFSDLSKFTIGYRKDSYYFAEFHEKQTLKTVPYVKDRDMGRDFIAGTIDLIMVNNKAGTERAFLGLGFDEYKYAELTFIRNAQLYLLYSHAADKQKVFDRIDQVIVDMKQSGLITDIYRSFDTLPLR